MSTGLIILILASSIILYAVFLYCAPRAMKSIAKRDNHEDVAGWIIVALCSFALASLLLFNLYHQYHG